MKSPLQVMALAIVQILLVLFLLPVVLLVFTVAWLGRLISRNSSTSAVATAWSRLVEWFWNLITNIGKVSPAQKQKNTQKASQQEEVVETVDVQFSKKNR